MNGVKQRLAVTTKYIEIALEKEIKMKHFGTHTHSQKTNYRKT